MPSGPARRAVCLVSLRAGSLAAAVRRASKTMLARGIGGKVFAESKAQCRNFVQAVQKKRLQRLDAVSALCVPININIYAPFSGLVGIAQKFGFARLTDPRRSVYHSSRRQGNSPGEHRREAGNTMNHNPQEAHPMSSTTTATRHELLARLDELDQLADAINIPEGLTLERSYGAMLMANQLLEAIKAQKKAIRAALAKLI